MTYRAIFQLSSGDETVINSTASQISNLQKALPGQVEIELVCHGRSLPFVINEGGHWTLVIHQLAATGVTIVACENMLKANGKSANDLPGEIRSVPSAIAEIVIKQQEGWSYVKAGF